MIYTLDYKSFSIYSDCNKLFCEVVSLKEIFQKNGYPLTFIDERFKRFLGNLYFVKPKVLTVDKKNLLLVLLYLGSPCHCKLELKYKSLLKEFSTVVSYRLCLKSRPYFLTYFVLKTEYLKIFVPEIFINFSVVAVMHLILEKHSGI